MDFVTAVKSCLGKYATFQGRACRSEYWHFTLFATILSIIATIIDAAISSGVDSFGVISAILTVALLVPGLSVTVRRLHDRDRAGWWYLIIFIPVIGAIVLIVWFCTKGTEGPNRFGENPLGLEPVPAIPT